MRPDYEVEAELGRGGMGVVFLAREVALSRPVAIKVLKPGLDTAAAVEAFYREAQMLARIHSNHVAVVHRVGEPEGREGLFYFVMQLVRGETLQQRISRQRFAFRETLRLGADLLSGLGAIHQAELAHGDIKPANIFLTESGAVIADLGIARHRSDSDSVVNLEGRRAGTPDYMAPEQRDGTRPSSASDIYQAGAVLYEACTGRRWASSHTVDGQRWSGVPRRLVAPLDRALRHDPRERWPDAARFRAALQSAERRPAWTLLLTLPIALVAAIVVTWRPAAPTGILHPRVDLTLLRLGGGDSLPLALLGYTGERLESFSRISVRPISNSRVLPEPTSPEQIVRLNTTYYVSGKLRGDSLLELAVFDHTGRNLRRIQIARRGLDPLDWGHATADSLVCDLFRERCDEYRIVAGRGASRDARAVDAFLAGADAFQRDAYRVADQRFGYALALDPDFAPAAWQRALVHRWRRTLTLDELRGVYTRYAPKLEPVLVQLLEAQLENDLPTRFARYREVIAASPTLGAARLLYADEVFHRGALIGLPLDSALAAMETAVNSDSTLDQAPALDHLIWGWIRLGNQAKAEQALQQREAVAEQHHTSEYDESSRRTRFLRLAYDHRFRPRIAAVKRWWLITTANDRILAAFAEYSHLGNSFDIPDAEQALGEALVRGGRSDSLRAEGFEGQGLALILEGRPLAALARFDSAGAGFATRAANLESGEWRLLASSLGMPGMAAEVTEQGRRRVVGFLDDSILAARAAWALGTEAYTSGDVAAAREYAARIDARVAPLSAPGRLRRLLAAFDSAAAGRLREAVDLSTPLLRYDPEVRAGDPFARAVLYLARASWLEQLGRPPEAEQALRWYENADIDGWGQREAQAGEIDQALSALGRLRRARIALLQDRAGTACAWLGRVGELWRDAEPGIRSLYTDLVASSGGRCR